MGDGSDRARELITAMLDPGFYAHGPERVELRETHASWVFLAGDLAFKVKKPVVLPFLDYGTVARRREMCRQEVRLNRRLAPSYYLGVDSILGGAEGMRLVQGDQPEAIEYVVRMRRVPELRTCESLAAAGELTPARVDAVARRIAEFHLVAEQAKPAARKLARLLEPVEENLRTLREVAPGLLDPDRLLAAERFTAAVVSAKGEQIADRAAAGWVRECHGDLRAEHVIVDGRVEVYDCIEFNPSLRQIDVAADLAFLVMDLTRLGRADLASRLVASYRDAGGDPGDDALLYFYASYRAWVRAKVACLRAGELSGSEPERDREQRQGRDLLSLGHRLAWRARMPAVIAICGVAASGKTVLGSRLAEVSGLRHLSSDVTRKRLAGVAPTQHAAPEHYAEEFTLRTYEELGRLARTEVQDRGGAIVDATFGRAESRRAFAAGLGDATAPRLFAACIAPKAVLLQRVKARAAAGPTVSDADAGVLERQLSEFEPLDEVGAGDQATIDTEQPIEQQVVEVEELANRRVGSSARSARSR
jgi:aminoglycoside phosphotransferase family enzyme/predicted kinase